MKLIYEALPNPEAIDLTRLGFPLKVDLAIALRLLLLEEKPAYIVLNKLRNRLAHDLDVEIGRTEEIELFHAMGSMQRLSLSNRSPDDFQFPDLLRRVIAVLFVSTEVALQKLIESKAETARLHQEMEKLPHQVEETLSGIEDRKDQR